MQLKAGSGQLESQVIINQTRGLGASALYLADLLLQLSSLEGSPWLPVSAPTIPAMLYPQKARSYCYNTLKKIANPKII